MSKFFSTEQSASETASNRRYYVSPSDKTQTTLGFRALIGIEIYTQQIEQVKTGNQ